MKIDNESFVGGESWFRRRANSLQLIGLKSSAASRENAFPTVSSSSIIARRLGSRIGPGRLRLGLVLGFSVFIVMFGFTARAVAQDSTNKADATPNMIYEWTDDSGRRHAADAVPEKYRATARRVDPNVSRISPDEQAEAVRQADALKKQAATIVIASPSMAIQSPPYASNVAGDGQRPSAAECLSWRRRYAASQDCFVGTTNPRGKTSYHSCTNEYVADPEPVCGR